MKKSIYSLVLSDGVIAEIDKAAYSMSTSRSNLINQVLADYVSYITPEKMMKEVFSSIESLLGSMREFQFMLQPSDTMISLRSALAYKYNPTVKYSVELYKSGSYKEEPLIGELRVSLRTQNANLILYIIQFFKLWSKIENAYIGNTDYVIEDGRYMRKLYITFKNGHRPEVIDNDKLGELIAGYIQTLDGALKKYFSNLDNPALAAVEVERLYNNYLSNQREILIN